MRLALSNWNRTDDCMNIRRLKNQTLAKMAGRMPSLANRLAPSIQSITTAETPWIPVTTPLEQAKIGMVTTAGVHHRHQQPFDMLDPNGDPSFRILDGNRIGSDYTITHDYYDHRDADKDLNIILPLDRLAEMAAAGVIGSVAEKHYSFMGHITGGHLYELIEFEAPEVAARMVREKVDAVLLTPG